ncbi:Membrane protein involved in the export of O-antigen and teichoic acid [Mucilaginibacter mallensis]|uniref:Membrane protein involved in the export of O-antigen and teichoic acid n=2 Tax=Mucilaginibacter mallensis TaxID=652787 RepID=A0A1H1WSJ9_MUCMA|nr:oligosaccharide flippase family protein [Mucilaginibacter mallensis]SDT00015.1 Membrane protein involved in the export of O-antigen and teichoic acid [Mucilaginibacter mallensis]
MLQAIQTNIHRFLTQGHERSLRAKKNIIKSVFIKGGSVIISLMLIPLTINYVNPTQYGIWLTLSSIITWAALFDMGLGNGLKNKLAEVIALNDMSRAKSYVSSTYAILLIISTLLFIVFCLINPYINWAKVLNVQAGVYEQLNQLVLIIFAFFCFQFIVELINTVLSANHAPAKSALMNMIAQLLTLVVIVIATRYKPGSLIELVIIMAGIPLLVMIAGSIILFNGSYKLIAPNIAAINFKYAKELLTVGGSFFIIQIGALVLYGTDNIVITQLFGPKEVTVFNVAYKLFSVILMIFMLVITPFWSAFTEAYVKDDYDWIRNAIAKINRLWGALSLLSILLLIISPWLYTAWVGKSISVPLSLSVAMCCYMISLIWQATHVQLLNGTGKIKLQFYLVIFSSIVNIPLSIFLGRRIGVAGVTFSNVILLVMMGIVFSIQTNKIINKTASGIFNA